MCIPMKVRSYFSFHLHICHNLPFPYDSHGEQPPSRQRLGLCLCRISRLFKLILRFNRPISMVRSLSNKRNLSSSRVSHFNCKTNLIKFKHGLFYSTLNLFSNIPKLFRGKPNLSQMFNQISNTPNLHHISSKHPSSYSNTSRSLLRTRSLLSLSYDPKSTHRPSPRPAHNSISSIVRPPRRTLDRKC